MSGEVRPCASGCRLRDRHASECVDEACRGCLPRYAEHGVLCAWCWQKLADALADVPVLVTHLRATANALAEASGRPLDALTVRAGDPATRTVLHGAWLAADDLESLVASWALLVLEEHPARLRGPNAAPWHGDVVAWMAPHLAWISRHDWAPVMRRELSTTIATARARWPLPEDVERHRPIPDVRCPRCDRAGLWYYPPSFARQPFAVACQNSDCGRVFTEDEWTRLVHLLARAEAGA